MSITMRLFPLLVVSLLPSTVSAFGGFFGRAALDDQVTSTGDSIVFSVVNDKVQLQIQLDYDQATEGDSFGWILPVPAVPTKLDVGSSLFLNALFQETLPTFQLDISEPGTTAAAVTSTLGQECSAEVLQNNDCPIQGPTRGTMIAPVTVWAEGHAGLLTYQVLEGTKPAVLEWLQTNEWSGIQNLEDLLDYYDATGSVYVVLKVNPQAVTGALQPVLIEYDIPAGAVHKVPTLLSPAAPRTLQVYFLTDQANTRAVPVNYLDVELDDTYVDWVGCLAADGGPDACYYKDYQSRYRSAVSTVSNQTLTTEYYGPARDLLANKIAIDIVPASLETASNWLEFLHLLEQANVPPIPAVQGILDRYIPPKNFLFVPPFQCAQWNHVYQPGRTASPSMNDCFEVFTPPEGWTWDPVGLTASLEDNVFAPARAAEHTVSLMGSLTRLYGELMQPTSTPEPHFLLTPNLPLVNNVHRATALPLCDDFGSTSALEITLTDNSKTFWQPAVLSCPTWKKTSPQPVLDPTDDTKVTSLATLFTAWGNHNAVVVPRDVGSFSANEISTALDYGDAVLATLTDRPEGEFPGVPISGTIYIDIMNDDNWSGQALESSNSSGGIRPSGRMVATITMMATVVLGLFL